MLAIFLLTAALIIYHHALYPVVLSALARHKPQPARPAQRPPADQLPFITLIIPCHNEAAVIERKIMNLEEINYPHDKFNVVLAIDGATDATAALARRTLATSKVRYVVVEYPTNRGKVAVLNEQISSCSSDLVALSDASSVLHPQSLEVAASWFADPTVGVVCASYRVDDPDNPGELAYWKYQIAVKISEARIGAPLGAHGAFYLFRRNLWTELPADTINDDFVLPMRIVLRGHRAVYDTTIETRELERTKHRQEFRRRVRIGAGNLQQALRLWQLALPNRLGTAFAFVSGKALRAVMPFIILLNFAALLALAGSEGGVYVLLAATATAAMGTATTVAAMRRTTSLPGALRALEYLFIGYVASGLGALLLAAGKGPQVWAQSRRVKTDDQAEPAETWK